MLVYYEWVFFFEGGGCLLRNGYDYELYYIINQ